MKQNKQTTRPLANQQGFTLVEIAIVLVIIGLLLGGVLKGQELIENSKVKRAAADLNGISAAYNTYFDRYRRIPGDDGPLATLIARGGDWVRVTQFGNNNGVINSTAAQTFNGAGENDNFWQHLRASGLLSGNTADAGVAALPRNPFTGLIGITSDAVMGTTGAAATRLGGNKVCISRVPGKLAATLDAQLDDGITNTGSLRATRGVAGQNTVPGITAAAAAAGTTGYSEANEYTICRSL